MTWNTGWNMYAINTPSGLVDGCNSNNHQTNDEETIIRADGLVDPTFVAMMSQMPAFDFTTHKIAQALGFIGIDGLAITSAVDTYWQKMAQGGTRAGAGNHIKAAATTGMIVPMQISASQGGLASADFRFLMRSSDGETDPVSISTGQNLAGSPTVDEAFTAGPFDYNGTLDDGVQDISIDFGVDVVQEMGGGHVYPTFVGINFRQPSITVQTKDISFAESTIGRAGVAISSGALGKVWLRKKSNAGANVAAATTSHILFTINEGRAVLVSGEGQQDQTGTATIRITPTYDGSNDILAINTGAAIA